MMTFEQMYIEILKTGAIIILQLGVLIVIQIIMLFKKR